MSKRGYFVNTLLSAISRAGKNPATATSEARGLLKWCGLAALHPVEIGQFLQSSAAQSLIQKPPLPPWNEKTWETVSRVLMEDPSARVFVTWSVIVH